MAAHKSVGHQKSQEIRAYDGGLAGPGAKQVDSRCELVFGIFVEAARSTGGEADTNSKGMEADGPVPCRSET